MAKLKKTKKASTTTKKLKSSSSRPRYFKRTKEQTQARANRRGGMYDSIIKDGIPTWTPKEGKNRVRIFPNVWNPDLGHYGMSIYTNYNIGPLNQSYLSLYKMRGEDDPIEEERREAASRGDTDYAKTLTPTERTAVWMIDRDEVDKGPQLWLMPASMDRQIVSLTTEESEDGGVIDIEDPEDGYDIHFVKVGTGLKTKYEALRIARDPSPLSKSSKKIDKWLKYVTEHPIDECLQYYPYEHIKRELYSIKPKDADDEDDGDGDDEPKRKTKKKTSVKKKDSTKKKIAPAKERTSSSKKKSSKSDKVSSKLKSMREKRREK